MNSLDVSLLHVLILQSCYPCSDICQLKSVINDWLDDYGHSSYQKRIAPLYADIYLQGVMSVVISMLSFSFL